MKRFALLAAALGPGQRITEELAAKASEGVVRRAILEARG
jgi:hypothetical protein